MCYPGWDIPAPRRQMPFGARFCNEPYHYRYVNIPHIRSDTDRWLTAIPAVVSDKLAIYLKWFEVRLIYSRTPSDRHESDVPSVGADLPPNVGSPVNVHVPMVVEVSIPTS